MTGDDTNPYVHGLESVKTSYVEALKNITLAGPTIFTNIIRRSAELASNTVQSSSNQKYTVLMILTDGEVNDMESTIDTIVEVSTCPLSIVIIGIGDADFTNMHTLDGDEIRLKSSRGVTCSRDIVNFVALREYLSLIGTNREHEFMKRILEEIPTQVLQYYKVSYKRSMLMA